MGFVPGAKDTFSDSADHILDLRDGLDFLSPRRDGIGLLKRIGTNGKGGKSAKSFKHEWTEVTLATRKETVTIAAAGTNPITVANAYQYQVNDIVRIENEIIRVTAIASATTLTVTRGYAGTTAAAHTAKPLYNMGSADPENSPAPASMAHTGSRLYNYVQTFTRAVEMSNDEIAQLTTDGNHMTGEIKRTFLELNRLLAMAIIGGVRYEDTANKIHTMGGLKQFVTTNVTNVAGAVSIAAIDAIILAQVQAGGVPSIIALSPYQKQKLDALDANKQLLGKSEHTGGNLKTATWQSGILDYDLDVFVDHSFLDDELHILSEDHIDIMPLSNNGINGAFNVSDATTPGQDGKKNVMRGKYTMEVGQEKAHGYLYGLT